MGKLKLLPRRRPVRECTDKLGKREREGNDIPMGKEELPECIDGESGRDLRKIDRRRRPKLTHVGINTLETFNRPLERGDRVEMSAERQWMALELVGLTKKKDPTTVVGEGRAATVTTSPKPPPPKAPMATYARDPSRRSKHLLDGKGSKGDSKGKGSPGKSEEQIREGTQRKGPQRREQRKGFQT